MPPWLQLVGVALLVVAVPVGYRGLRWVQRYRRLLLGGAPDAGDVRSPGTVTLSGTVQAASPFVSPLSGERCVLMRWTIEEWNDGGHVTSGWRTVASGTFGTEFELDDRTGSVAVDPREHTPDGVVDAPDQEFLEGGGRVDPDVVAVLEEPRPRTTREPGAVSGRLEQFETAAGVGRPSGPLVQFPLVDRGKQDGERRYSERLVEPGDVVTVVGDAVVDEGADRPPAPGDVTVRPRGRTPLVKLDALGGASVHTPTGDELLVSEHPEPETTARIRRMTLMVPWALVLAGLGGGTLAAARGLLAIDPSSLVAAGVGALLLGAVLVRPPSEW